MPVNSKILNSDHYCDFNLQVGVQYVVLGCKNTYQNDRIQLKGN